MLPCVAVCCSVLKWNKFLFILSQIFEYNAISWHLGARYLNCSANSSKMIFLGSVFILQAVLSAPIFVWGFSSSQGISTRLKLSKDFQRSNESHFRRKIPVIIVPNFETGINHCVPCDVIFLTARKGAENWSRAVHVRPRGLERCTAIFGASFARLFWTMQAPCGVASKWKERHGSTPQIYTTLHHILAHLLVSPWPTKTCSFAGSIKLCCVDKSLLGCCGQFRKPLWRILLHIYRWMHQ